MTIKRRIYLNTFFTLVILLGMFISLIALSYKIENEIRYHITVQELLGYSSDLSSIIGQYLLTGNQRSRNQWEIIDNKINKLLEENSEELYLQSMTAEFYMLKSNFLKLVKEYELNLSELSEDDKLKSENLREMLSSSLLINSQNILSVVFNTLNDSSRRIGRYNNFSRLVFIILSILIISINLLISNRIILRVSNPLKRLVDGVKEVRNGNLDFFITDSFKYNDEVTELGLGFNDMTEELHHSFNKTNCELLERHKAERALIELKTYLRSIINSMPSILIGINNDKEITQWNHKAEEVIGYPFEDVEGEKVFKIIPEIEEYLGFKNPVAKSRELKFSEDTTKVVEIVIYPLKTNGLDGSVIRIDDVTEKAIMKEVMVQTEKMLSLGGLAAGMAHEINNPLAGLLQVNEVLYNRLTNKTLNANINAAKEVGTSIEAINNYMEIRNIIKMLETIKESGQRISKIIKNMLSFSRKSEGFYTPVNIEEVIEKSVYLTKSDYNLKEHFDFKLVEIEYEFEDGIPFVECDISKIQQVLLNILRNGAQAMTDAKISSPKFVLRTKYLTPEDMVLIEIEDNGPGIPEMAQKKIFEPFYTTKPEGIGTGLGLSVSYFIITNNHKGKIYIDSKEGFGTTFCIKLPIRHRQD